jgi:hypothetical protein
MRRFFAALICLLAIACTTPAQEPAADQPRRRTTLVPVSPGGEGTCPRLINILQTIEVPLQLIADGGTPVSFTDDLRRAGRELQGATYTTSGAVKTFATGLGGDLMALTDALDAGENGAAVARGDVVTNRVRNLRHACTSP